MTKSYPQKKKNAPTIQHLALLAKKWGAKFTSKESKAIREYRR